LELGKEALKDGQSDKLEHGITFLKKLEGSGTGNVGGTHGPSRFVSVGSGATGIGRERGGEGTARRAGSALWERHRLVVGDGRHRVTGVSAARLGGRRVVDKTAAGDRTVVTVVVCSTGTSGWTDAE